MTSPEDDLKYMKLAIAEAKKSRREDERTHPLVGCVVVSKDGELLVSAHRGELEEGEHAEYTALEKKLFNTSVVDCTVYTTLEPCTARNRPKLACALRILERKVRRVVVGMLDPNPQICGRGVWLLRDQRIATDFFPDALMSEIEELNREFIRTHRPPARLELPASTAAEPPPLEAHPKDDALAMTNEAATDSTDNLFAAMLDAIWERRFDEARAKSEELQRRVEDPAKAKRGRALYLTWLYRYQGKAETLEELKGLADDPDAGDLVASSLAELALMGKDYDDAIAKFRQAADLAAAHNSDYGVTHLIDLAEAYITTGQLVEARATVLEGLSKKVGDLIRARLLTLLAKICGEKSQSLMKAALLTRASQLLPANTSKRFDAAYALGEEKSVRELAVSHYETILRLEPKHPNALNNFGVACQELGMTGKAVESYVEAANLGESLPASNLAVMYTKGGFYTQATETLDRASKMQNVHENVAVHKTTLQARQKEEAERWTEVSGRAVQQQRFLSLFADAVTEERSDAWQTVRWSTHERSDTIAKNEKADDQLSFEWGIVEKGDRRRMALRLEGNAAFVTIEKLNLHGFAADSVDGVAFLTKDRQEIRFMVPMSGASSPLSFVSWKVRRDEIEATAPKLLPGA